MRLLKIFLFYLGLMVFPVQAELKIDVSGAQSEPTPIAVPEFYALNTKKISPYKNDYIDAFFLAMLF